MPFFQLPPQRKPKQTGDNYINPARRTYDNTMLPFYQSAEWKKFRETIIAERGKRCEDNEHEKGKPMSNIVLDHIKELKDGGAPFDRSNVMLRCRSCHVRKTSFERQRRIEVEHYRTIARQDAERLAKWKAEQSAGDANADTSDVK